MKKLLRFSLLIACLVAVGHQGWTQYISSGPYGGAVYGFYRDGVRLLAAGTGGVYQTSNEGRSWQELNTNPVTFGCDPIYSVAAFGRDMYAGSLQTGIYRSSDFGANWNFSVTGLRIAFGSSFTDVEISGPNVIAVRADSGFLFLSTDRGNSWSRINGAITGAPAYYLSVHNMDVFVNSTQGIFKSTDNGFSYTNVNSAAGNFGKMVWVNDTLYIASTDGIRMSTDDAANFTTIGLGGRAVRSVAFSNGKIYAVVRNPAPIQDSVLMSTNGGAAFTAVPFNASDFRFTSVYDLAPTVNGVAVATNYGLYGTSNNGNSWGLLDSGYNATSVRGLTASGPYVFAAAAPMGVYRVRPDSGALAWEHSGDVSDGITENVQAITSKGQYVHLATGSGYFRSSDSGATWTSGAIGASGGNVTSVFANQSSSDVWMIRNGDLYFSSDDGNSFGHVIASSIPAGISQRVFKIDTNLFVSSFGMLYRGSTNTMIFSPVSGISGYVTAMVSTGNRYYAGTSYSGLYSSTDRGAHWSVAPPAPGSLSTNINALIVDSAGTGLIAGTDNGIYSNSSGTWGQDALAGHSVLSLAMRNGKLFVGTCSGAYSVPYKIIPPPAFVASTRNGVAGMQIWPNPTKGNFSLRVQSAKAGESNLLLTDMMGSVVLRQAVSLKAGTNEFHIAMQQLGLVPGVYTVQIAGEAMQAAGRIVVY